MNYDNEYLEHFKAILSEILGEEYNLHVTWFNSMPQGFIPAYLNSEDKNVYVVLNKIPSVTYGEVISQGFNISVFANQNLQHQVFNSLEEYAGETYNKKQWLDSTMIKESYLTPNLDQAFIEYSIENGCQISFSGSVLFSPYVSDIESLQIFGEDVDYTLIEETFTTQPISQQLTDTKGEYQELSDTFNQSAIYQISVRLINFSNKQICNIARLIKTGQLSINYEIPVKLIYTDNEFEVERKMVITAISNTFTKDNVPIVALTLTDRTNAL